MTDVAINVQNLSKRYSIQTSRGMDLKGTLRESLARSAKLTVQRISRMGAPTGSVQSGKEDYYALKDVEFSVTKGQVLGVIGRNGAGKSTLLKILSRITEPTTGRIEIVGRVSSLLEVGTGFHPELTGRENIYLNGALLGMARREIQAKFEEIVAFADIEQFLDVPVKRYSSGMFVRLAFSVAAHLEPDILIVDEVLAVGDIAFQRKCLGKMNEVATQSGRTILFVSHQMSAVQRLCTKAIVLEKGRITFQGGVPEAISLYVLNTSELLGNGENLRELKRPHSFVPTLPIMLDKCFAVSASQEPLLQLNFGAPLSLYLEVVSEKSVSDFTVRVSLDSQTHTRVFTLQSEQMGASYSFPQPGRLGILLEVGNLFLIPGNYTINVSIHRLGSVLDRLDQAASVEILPIGELDSLLPQDQSGLIAPPVTWKTSPLISFSTPLQSERP